jgi:hypothetical protein
MKFRIIFIIGYTEEKGDSIKKFLFICEVTNYEETLFIYKTFIC